MAGVFDDNSIQRIRRSVHYTEGRTGSVGGRTRIPPMRSERRRPSPLATFQVVNEENDYLVCKRLNSDGTLATETINVAKVPELRHDTKHYDEVASLTTNAADEVDVTFSGSPSPDPETWVVKPPFIPAGGSKEPTVILAARSPMAADVEVTEGEGAEAEDVPLQWQDLNVAGRVWGLEED